MKKLKKIILWFVAVIAVAILSAMSYLKFALPNVGDAPDMKIEATPERIARGEYLANHVTVCIDCHSKRDWTKFSGPPIEGTFGQGGEVFDQKFGFPGTYYAVNITPEGIGNYTDGELFRAITTGVNKEGKALFPVMPYHYYGQMDPEDIKCIIAYIRTLKPIKNDVPKSESDFPMNFIINTIPQKAQFTTLPPKTDIAGYGKYLAYSAACIECHTKFDKGGLIAGTEFGGGREFPLPDGSVLLSHNITPDKETGIGKWSAERFIHTFRERSDSATMHTTLKQGDFNTIMPWIMYGKMTDADLKAIFVYLQTVKPISNKVELFAQSK
ncbi:c-type cytochrome [Ignavibacteria bacterium]|jgi:mono/diheme cytochrome c family protein|nr:c-type cytochrome [Bacteroidota bacterium]MCZ2133515.1 cytochrome c [Bacteroidota bacterium]